MDASNKKGDTSLYYCSDNTSEHNNNGAGIENYNFITHGWSEVHVLTTLTVIIPGENYTAGDSVCWSG
ncbi:hypothetical protein ACLB1S_31970 [Escherichia coli]